MRGRHWLIFDTIENVHAARRVRSEGLNFPSTLLFHKSASAASNAATGSFSALSQALPDNVKLVTLTNNYADFNDGKMLLRLSHLYEAGEHPTLAVPVTINLENIFSKAGLAIKGADETSLTGNQGIAFMDSKKFKWKTFAPNEAVEAQQADFKEKAFEERVPFAYPEVTIRPM